MNFALRCINSRLSYLTDKVQNGSKEPSYTKLFRAHTLYHCTASSTLNCTNFKFFRASEIPFKVSETLKIIKNFPFGYHGNSAFSEYLSQCICKTANFQILSKTTILSSQNKTLCDDSCILLLFRKVIYR